MQEEFLSISSKAELAQLEFARQKELQQRQCRSIEKFAVMPKQNLKYLKPEKVKFAKAVRVNRNKYRLHLQAKISICCNYITSPINGAISNVLVNIGSYVDANNPIAEIVDNSQLHLDLYVYEKDLQKLKVGQTIHFTLTNNPGKEYDADVYAISNTFEQNTKAIAVHATVKRKQARLD
jgi:cobalt-zinc-cadmium efflux system membrane fusion protein